MNTTRTSRFSGPSGQELARAVAWVGEALPASALFRRLRLGPLELRNRLVVPPMARASADERGLATRRMASYYARFAAGGFGAVFSEGLHVDRAHSQGLDGQPGLADDAQADAWRLVTDAVHRAGTPLIAALDHAGPLGQRSRQGRTVGPSALRPLGRRYPAHGGQGPFARPAALRPRALARIVSSYGRAAARAVAAGFDGVEVVAGEGHLLDAFLTPATNRRRDAYGGAIENRARLLREVARAVRDSIGTGRPLGASFTVDAPNGAAPRWEEEDEARRLFALLREDGLDFLRVEARVADAPTFVSGATLAAVARRASGLPVLAGGGVSFAEGAVSLLEGGHADGVALGRAALMHPDWPLRVLTGEPIARFDPSMFDAGIRVEGIESWSGHPYRPADAPATGRRSAGED
jgi:2,4-dienoyl-CoA reductase-like NADH-dependent reductase (Old Yellow Enzyme family)